MAEVLTTTSAEGHDDPNKKSVWRLLRENPYLFGLSAVSIYQLCTMPTLE
jgi:hypothetical protein